MYIHYKYMILGAEHLKIPVAGIRRVPEADPEHSLAPTAEKQRVARARGSVLTRAA